MPSISTIYTTLDSTITNSTTSFAEVVESSALVDGTEYHVICYGLIEASTNSNTYEWRLVDRTNSDAVLSDSTIIREPTQAARSQTYAYLGKITAGSDGGGIALEQRAVSAATNCSTHFVSMLLLDLDNLASTDFFFANDQTGATHTTAFAKRVSHTLSDSTQIDGQSWLVFGWADFATNSESVNTVVSLSQDQDADTTLPQYSFEGEDLSEELSWMVCRPYTFSTGNNVIFSIESKDDGSVASQNAYIASTLFGLRLGAFKNSASYYDDDAITSTATTFQEIARRTVTPDSSGDVVAVGSSIFVPASTNRKSSIRIQVDNTTSPNTVPDGEWAANSNDGSDELPLFYLTKYAGVADTAATLDLDAKKTSSADIGWKQISLAAFTTELSIVTPVTFAAVATQSSSSGDVAAQGYDSGDTAAQPFASGDQASEARP